MRRRSRGGNSAIAWCELRGFQPHQRIMDEAFCVRSVRAVTSLDLRHVTQEGIQEVISHEIAELSSRSSKLRTGGI